MRDNNKLLKDCNLEEFMKYRFFFHLKNGEKAGFVYTKFYEKEISKLEKQTKLSKIGAILLVPVVVFMLLSIITTGEDVIITLFLCFAILDSVSFISIAIIELIFRLKKWKVIKILKIE